MASSSRNAASKRRVITRRNFLGRTVVAAAAPVIIPASARGADGHVAPSERIALGLIGHGMMGRGHLGRLLSAPEVEVLALCEVDRTRLDAGLAAVAGAYAERIAGGTYGACGAYTDYRELLARDDIDGVVIATPDHWHSPMSIHAAEAGKDVYCEKPISITIDEGRQLVHAVRRHGRVFQNGSQYRTSPSIRRACDFIRQGGLGNVTAAFTLWNTMEHFIGGGRFQACAASVNPAVTGKYYAPQDYALPEEPCRTAGLRPLVVPPGALTTAQPHEPHAGLFRGRSVRSRRQPVHSTTRTRRCAAVCARIRAGPVDLLIRQRRFPLTCRYASLGGTTWSSWAGQCLYQSRAARAQLDGSFGGKNGGRRAGMRAPCRGQRVTGGQEELMAST